MTTRSDVEMLQAVGLLVATLPPSQRVEYVRYLRGRKTPASGQATGFIDVVKNIVGSTFQKKIDAARYAHEGYHNQGVRCLVIGEEQYPEALANIYDPPLCLFVQGSLDNRLISQTKVAIVGSRRSNREGEEIAFSFAKELAQESIAVVSGLALGIDSSAHKGALSVLDTGLKTIGVLGSGFNKFYPPYNLELRDTILSADGIILSQFPPDCPPYPANFLNRNRVIAGLSRATIVVQATARSGSLATARFALEEGRELFVVPGGIYDPRYEGSLQLLKQGAGLVANVSDVFDLLDLPRALASKIGQTSDKPLSPLHAIVAKEQRVHVDTLKRLVTDSDSAFEEQILQLELQGVIEREAGNYIRLVRT